MFILKDFYNKHTLVSTEESNNYQLCSVLFDAYNFEWRKIYFLSAGTQY